MYRFLVTYTFLLVFFLFSSASFSDDIKRESGSYPIWLSQHSPVKSIGDVEVAWTRPFLDGVKGRENKYHEWLFINGEREGAESVVADNCEAIFRLEKEGYEANPGLGRPIYHEQRNDCDFIDQLRNARPAKKSFVRDIELKEYVVDILPVFLSVGISCDMMCRFSTADRLAIPISRFYQLSDISSGNKFSLHFKEDDIQHHVYLLAKGDFDGDGIEDLFVNRGYYYSDIRAHTGNKNYVLTRYQPGGVLRVVNLNSHLCNPVRYRCRETHSDLSHWLDADR